MAAAACGGSSTGPSPGPLSLTCPPQVEGQAADPAGVPVQYQVTVQGGRPPAPVVCTPASGSTFPVGSTSVSCTVTDASLQTTGCTFPVLVTQIPRLRRTRFLAFGDSMTAGQTSLAPMLLMTVGLPDAYPGQLEQKLKARYTAQDITVLNRGRGGETAARGLERLPGVLDEDRPEVLLLLEGVNNIRFVPTEQLAEYLDDMVRAARRRNIDVLIATLLPTTDDRLERIKDLNEEIFDIARRRRIGDPVDLFSVFSSEPSLIGMDGLHPTAAGYSRMAEVFFEAIRERFEEHPPSESIALGMQAPASPGRGAPSTSAAPPPSEETGSRSALDGKQRTARRRAPQR
jgi:lysophospholipase L1-like esterase